MASIVDGTNGAASVQALLRILQLDAEDILHEVVCTNCVIIRKLAIFHFVDPENLYPKTGGGAAQHRNTTTTTRNNFNFNF